jgi:uncharacterized protein YecT (DUF1311 family)
MKTTKFIVFLATMFAFSIQVFGEEKIPHTNTQRGMNEAAVQRLKQAETEMRGVFDALIAKAQGKTDAIGKLRKAQSAWETYRDLQLEAYWPSPKRNSYGSVYPVSLAELKRELTEARTRELRKMLAPGEGEVCATQWP